MQQMEEIYQKYARTVYQYLLSMTHDSALAEELTQETFYQAIRSIDRFDGSSSISTWLCAIAKRQLWSYRRKHPALEEINEQDVLTESAEKDALESISRVDLLKRMHLCPEPFREI